ncbi:hypothetical protein ACOBQB_10215 [Streptomyces sp. G5(2025)]|uniref:hypothetical protein n=1 Tax=Streptomyces sp. G5(2025) TaxID=3406628 RepID=UPI003C1BA3D5
MPGLRYRRERGGICLYRPGDLVLVQAALVLGRLEGFLDQVGVGDERAARGHGVGVCGFDQLDGFRAGGDGGEAVVGDQLAAEAPAQFLDQFSGGFLVQDGEVGQAQRTELVEEGAVDGQDAGPDAQHLEGALQVVRLDGRAVSWW